MKMKIVGIRELKEKLSAYIDEVQTGKIILVTDRGKEVALLSPLSSEFRLLRVLGKSGKARWAGGKPQGLNKEVIIEGKPLSSTILEERE
ncbi:MAG: type II toxin-antitoxin system prevent-host-death family antitoxin [Bacteroidales bacterium]|jgi:prevent-host-death family protein|nr:type II toxin-antitoxin system prevent-host-death family antitoxin [Bacteroidales bacterium]NMC93247.1 type II toxin-antitoxin system prevent-host-death family antitoxin [Syntrophorhabdus sp.]